MMLRVCRHVRPNGQGCLAAPMADAPFCFWHSPDHSAEVVEAGRLGGLRRTREHTVGGAYQVEGLGSVAQIRRLLEIAVVDCLSLDNSVARVRSLAYLGMVALKLLEDGELEARLAAVEAVVTPPRLSVEAIFPGGDGAEADEGAIVFVEEEPA